MLNHRTWGMDSDPAEDWRENARCRPTVHKRPEMFYPLGLDKGTDDTAGIEIAKKFCQACPVREACLEEALRLGERWGVWGGLTPAERQALQRRPAPVRVLTGPLCAKGKHQMSPATTGQDRRGGTYCRPCRGRWEVAEC